MKQWILNNRLSLIGVVAGALAGALYWKYVGCLTGNCAITSKPLNSIVYFAVAGFLLSGLFKKEKAKDQSEIISKNSKKTV